MRWSTWRSYGSREDIAIEKFGATLHGELIRPGEPGYDDARRVWNGMIDRRPALIARCLDEHDVIHAVRFAADDGLLIAVRGGGHNVAGFGTCDGGLVIDLSPMKGIRVDTAARTAHAQPGLTWGEFDDATQAHGFTTTGGLVSPPASPASLSVAATSASSLPSNTACTIAPR